MNQDLELLLEQATQKGSDKQFREWISHQRSCVSGLFSEWHNGEGRSIACHVRRSSESGTGYKPPYCCIPLTFAEHAVQHGKRGERGCLMDAGWDFSEEEAKAWFDQQRIKYLRLWLDS